MASSFEPTSVFYLAGKMLQGMVDLPSLHVYQMVATVFSHKDFEELVSLRAKLVGEAIDAFKK